MYRGKSWKILLPRKEIRPYREGELDLARGVDLVYEGMTSVRLAIATKLAITDAREKGQTLSQAKLLGFSSAGEKYGKGIVRVFQNFYLTFGAATWMVDSGAPGNPSQYGSNLGYMTTVRTTDNKSLHSLRRKEVASWPGFESLFGGGLAGPENGDADFMANAGIPRITMLMRQRVASELGLQEKDLLEVRVLGVVEGEKYMDHTIAYDIAIDRTSAELLRDKPRLLANPAIAKKYADIFPVDLTDPESLVRHLNEARANTLDVAKGGIVLTGVNMFGEEFVKYLRHAGLIEN